MNSLNSIMVEGNLTRAPVTSTTPKGTTVCIFTIASHRFYREDDEIQEETSFFDVETWGRLAERCGEELTKGRGVRVVGRLMQDRWEDNGGRPHSRVKVVAEHVEFRRTAPVAKEEEASEEFEKDEVGITGVLDT